MKTKNDHFDVLKEIRQIRKKIYKEIKNMSIEEQAEYFRKGAERFDAKIEQYRREKNNENEKKR